MADNCVQDLLAHVFAGEQSQELRLQLLQLEEKRQLIETTQQEILLIEQCCSFLQVMKTKLSCVLVLIFVEALDGITHL